MNLKDIPEHRFTKRQVAALVKLLDPKSMLKRSPNINDAARAREDLENAARWFTSDLVLQNAPTDAQDIEKLDRVVANAKRLIRDVSDSDIAGYLRFEAGDVVPEDRKLQSLIDAVREFMRLAEDAAKRREHDRNNLDQYKRECSARGLEWSKPKFVAMRVLIQRLYSLWWRVDGKPPSGSPTTNFMKFAQAYIAAMREQTDKAHRTAAPNIDEQLAVTEGGIQSHVRILNEQRGKAARRSARGKSKGE